MKLRDIIQDLSAEYFGADAETEISGFTCDSRQVRPGYLFVALRGAQTDGHRYMASAAAQGAAAILCEEAEAGLPCLRVEDTRIAVPFAANRFYGEPSGELKIIGITGTNGKTTTAFLVKQLLERITGEKIGLIGSIVNMIGDEEIHTENTTPENAELQSLFRRMLDAGCRFCVMEVSSHALCLHRVDCIDFAVGIFTNLSQDHLDFHKDMDDYAAAKAQLFPRCKAALANGDDSWTDKVMALRSDYCRYGLQDGNDLRAEKVVLSDRGARFTLRCGEESAETSIDLAGDYNVYNALSAMGACMALGMSLADCAAALPMCSGAKGRLERVPCDGDYSIFIDYAVTPDAIENVLRTLRKIAPGRLVMLFGCGGDRDRKKRPIMGRISGELADFVIVTSDNPRTEKPEDIIAEILPGVEESGAPYAVIPDRIEAIHFAMDHHKEGDVVLLCGKGHEDYQIIGHTKIHMDEREIVAAHRKKEK